ncbi:MAG TPA: GspH/FimT family pseudopilin [Vicinamibacterales bacterium]|nr:GspH/FimT family pseudopilin [Vicinamibacterales bacterium]
MFAISRSQRGFSLIELLMIVAVAGTLMAIGLPALLDLSEGTKLNTATREIEREFASARLKAVTANRSLRVRLNCPAEGYFRTVEVVSAVVDAAEDRCLQSAYPFPVPDTDLATRPNYDGPIRVLGEGVTVTSETLEFRPDGTAFRVVANAAQNIAESVTITVSRRGKSRTVNINGAGRIVLQ